MTKLKTLRDLENQDWSTREEELGLVRAVFFDLREEAIKWVKFIESTTFYKEHQKHTFEEEYNVYANNWIKHFFNIQDSELK